MTYADSMQELIDHDSGQDMPVAQVTLEDYDDAIDALADEDIDGMHDIVFEMPFWKDEFTRWVATDQQLRRSLRDHKTVISKAAELAEKRAERQRECDAVDAAWEAAA